MKEVFRFSAPTISDHAVIALMEVAMIQVGVTALRVASSNSKAGVESELRAVERKGSIHVGIPNSLRAEASSSFPLARMRRIGLALKG